MVEFILVLDDTIEMRVLHHTMTVEFDERTYELYIEETQRDWNCAEYKFLDEVTAVTVSVGLGISIDELMDECIKILQKV